MATITVPLTDFRDLLAGILPIAGKDDMLPILTGVMIEAVGRDTLTAYATDRFRVGLSRIKIETAPRPRKFKALIPAKQLAAVLAGCKPPRRAMVPATLTLTTKSAPGLRTVVNVSSDQPNAAGLIPAYTLDTIDGEYPAVLGILRAAHEAGREAATWTGVNPGFLADFRHAVREPRHEGLTIRMGVNPTKPIAVAAGDYFLGALMPRRSFDHHDAQSLPDYLTADWADVFPPAEPEAKAS